MASPDLSSDASLNDALDTSTDVFTPASELASRLEDLLGTRSFGRSIRWYDEVTSTNSLASDWAGGDAADGSVVCAEVQTAGRGRLNRSWSARKGENLTFSLILFPGLAADQLGMISVAFSVAVAATLKDLIGTKQVEIKWPNDILIEGAKICGILQESAIPSIGGQKRVVAGIGLNVNQTDFPPEIRDRATSLRMVAGREYDRVELLASLLTQMEGTYYALHTGGASALRARYEANLNVLGRKVDYVRQGDGTKASGIVTGIDPRGGLIVSAAAGRETILAGDVSLRMD